MRTMIAAVCNRAGLTMGKVHDTRIQYEVAQDQYLGRFVAGLNVNIHKFSLSPVYLFTTENQTAFFGILKTFSPSSSLQSLE